ncbi:hypothetical protein Q9L42_020610 (plasmid) [Methylomarinum sp. Ch1-1]|uniref:Uncharacterized protein n=1 Tax=Methylomarinum roseum TaxID=3067653 RepID=A0AAU7P1K5_9GAMM|nr:hypothetical protein [Methylomarinum sp. Ch1-1]MDP4523322.1 hypothetical protein [Methylomarinum sp. Ch1-1]
MKDVLKHSHESSIETETKQIKVGQWCWCLNNDKRYNKDDEWLGCIMHIGSNYVLVEEPSNGFSNRYERIHFDKIHKMLRFEADAAAVIRKNIDESQEKIASYLKEIQAITARLGVDNHNKIGFTQNYDQNNQQALAVLSSTQDINAYKQDLIKAKRESLPNLFEKIEAENKNLAKWMSAETLPLKAMRKSFDHALTDIDHRIFNVSLYAGLTETVVQCMDGPGAALSDKLHVMQRKLYMDEECLLNYSLGGMQFNDIDMFDQWLCQPENRNRILPFPRTIVAMQVRRHRKERDSKGVFMNEFIN